MSSNYLADRLDAAVDELGKVDLAQLGDVVQGERLGKISAALCRVDQELSQLADALRSRGVAVMEGVDLVEVTGEPLDHDSAGLAARAGAAIAA